MKELQQLKDYLNVRLAKAQERFHHFDKAGNQEKRDIFYGKVTAFDDTLQMVELLLKHDTRASTESAHFANTMLGECAANDQNSNNEQLAGALGATRRVRQNEQTKEVCKRCGAEIRFNVGDMLCAECWSKS